MEFLGVTLSHLCESEIKHIFKDTTNPNCRCSFDFKSIFQEILHCPMYKNQTKTLVNTIKNTINFRLLDLTENLFLKMLSLENSSFNANTQTQTLDPTIECI